MVREFRDWVKSQLSDPLAAVEKIFDKLPVEEQIARVKDAERIGNELKCFSLQSELAQEFLRKEEGQAKWAQLWLREYHPDIDEVTAFAVFMDAREQIERAFHVTQGSLGAPPQQGPPQGMGMGMETGGNSKAPDPQPVMQPAA